MAIIIVISAQINHAAITQGAQINHAAITQGEISACKEVREHFKFPEDCRSVEFEVIDELGETYKLKARRRMTGYYPKEAIAGLKTYIQAKKLGAGKTITIFKEEKEVQVFGAVLGRSQRYFIRHD